MMAVVIILFFFRGVRKIVKIEIVGGRWGWWWRHDGNDDLGSGLVWQRFPFSSWSASANFDYVGESKRGPVSSPHCPFSCLRSGQFCPSSYQTTFPHATSLLESLEHELQRATYVGRAFHRQLLVLGSFFGTKAPQ